MLARTLLFNVLFYVNFIVIAVVLAPTMLLPLRHIWFVPKVWAGTSLWLHRTICGIGEDIRGPENIPDGGCLVACKHQSTWETLRLVTLFPKPTFVFKRQLRWLPLFGWYLIKLGQIPVNRGQRSKALQDMAAIAAERIAQGHQVIIFPEGTRRPPQIQVRRYLSLRQTGRAMPARRAQFRPVLAAADLRPPPGNRHAEDPATHSTRP
jgi:1-acyl-sn-glycerol-3-phosphate acyltransferase